MTEENTDPNFEFSIEDSTEEFENGEESSGDFQPTVTDFEEDPNFPDFDNGQDGDQGNQQVFSEPETTPEPTGDSQAASQISNPEQKSSTPQSFRVMRFEDFLNQPND